MPISVLDIAVLGVTLISAVLATVRGCAREVLGIAAWVIAAGAAWYLFPLLLPFTHGYIAHEKLALGVTIAGIFIVTLLIMSLITVQISDLILDSRIGALDRTLGLIFGIVRGFVVCAIGWLLFSMLLQGKVPDWAETAKTRPLLESTSQSIAGLFKSNTAQWLGTPATTEPVSEGAAAPSPGQPTNQNGNVRSQ